MLKRVLSASTPTNGGLQTIIASITDPEKLAKLQEIQLRIENRRKKQTDKKMEIFKKRSLEK
jgi:hypothetical protein